MTANLTITIDERNNVLKVPNSALGFTPQDALASVQARAQLKVSSVDANKMVITPMVNRNFAPASAPVLEGQTRLVC